MNGPYTFVPAATARTQILCNNEFVAHTETPVDAEVLLSYLNAADGGFTAEPYSEGPSGTGWALVQDDTWTAYVPTQADAEALLGHLNRAQA